MPEDRRCGTCKWPKDRDQHGCSDCGALVDEEKIRSLLLACVEIFLDRAWVTDYDGEDCPCWEPAVADRSCGTCRKYDLAQPMDSRCTAPVPDKEAGGNTRFMYPDDGTNCPCWEKRED